MKDTFNREINYLRISVTDRCDLRCIYCMKEKMEFLTLRVMPKNEPAIKLYEKLEFVNKGSTKQGDLLMKKSLV